jgi:hypothetical protein
MASGPRKEARTSAYKLNSYANYFQESKSLPPFIISINIQAEK